MRLNCFHARNYNWPHGKLKPESDMENTAFLRCTFICQSSQSPIPRTALPSALSFPALKGEVCRASDQLKLIHTAS
jgi:hypothetical protein